MISDTVSLVLAVPMPAKGGDSTAMDLSSALVDRVDAVFADMEKPQHPGAALLATDHGEIVCRKCYGLADVETQRPVTADSSFYLGSISKPFVAIAIMMLVEEGRLRYDDRLSAFFPAASLMGRGNFRSPSAAPHVGSSGLRSILQLQRRNLRMDPRDQWCHQRGRARTGDEPGRTGISCRRAIRVQRDGLCAARDDRRDYFRSILC